MAKTQARRAPANRPAGKGGSSRLYVFLALLIPTAIVLLPSFIVLTAAMVPTLVAYMVDGNRRKYLAATVGAMNLAGSLFFLVTLWGDQHDLATAIAVLNDVYGWLFAYGAAAVGYGVFYVMPTMTETLAKLSAEQRLARLDREMRELVQEWGEPVMAPPEE